MCEIKHDLVLDMTTKWEYPDNSVEPSSEDQERDESEESTGSFRESEELRSLEEQHLRDKENIEMRHRRELELEVEKRELEIKMKEMYLKDVERLQAENKQLRKEKNRNIDDKMKLRKKMEVSNKNYEKKIEDLEMKMEIDNKNYEKRIRDLEMKMEVGKKNYEKKIDELEKKVEAGDREKEEHQTDRGYLEHILNWAKRTDAERSSENSHLSCVDEAGEGMGPPSKRVKHV